MSYEAEFGHEEAFARVGIKSFERRLLNAQRPLTIS